jgi:hypothetical protein
VGEVERVPSSNPISIQPSTGGMLRALSNASRGRYAEMITQVAGAHTDVGSVYVHISGNLERQQ